VVGGVDVGAGDDAADDVDDCVPAVGVVCAAVVEWFECDRPPTMAAPPPASRRTSTTTPAIHTVRRENRDRGGG
jgi:hypothetical protein